MDRSNEDLINEIAQLKRDLAQAIAENTMTVRDAETSRQKSVYLEAMLETMPVGVVMAEAPSGKILMGNKRAEELVRHPIYTSEDVDSYGEWISFHADGRQVESHEYPLSKVIRDGDPFSELDVNYQRGDGTMSWLRIICHPIHGAENQRIGAAVALVDIDNERHLLTQQEVLIGELNHRVKNAFTVVKSIVSQSLRGSETTPEVRNTIDARLEAYSKAHSQLIGSRWDSALISEIANDTIGEIGDGRIVFDGPDIEVPSRVALALSMAFYELATNAVKHGSLSVPAGDAKMSWSYKTDDKSTLYINWTEQNGPEPVVPTTKGFGSKIIDRILAAETYGKVTIAYPKVGMTWQLDLPLTD